MRQMIENHPEPELLRFITDAIRPDPNDLSYPPIWPEYRAVTSTLFHIVLRALLASRVA